MHAVGRVICVHLFGDPITTRAIMENKRNNKFRLAMVQLAVGADKMANLKRAEGLVREAASNGAQVVSLPVSY